MKEPIAQGPVDVIVGRILLRCPKCHQEMMVDRVETDYPEAVRVECTCLECNSGDFAETMHFDADGRHIIRDPDETPNDTGNGPRQAQLAEGPR